MRSSTSPHEDGEEGFLSHRVGCIICRSSTLLCSCSSSAMKLTPPKLPEQPGCRLLLRRRPLDVVPTNFASGTKSPVARF